MAVTHDRDAAQAKSLHEVLREKESTAQRVRSEIEALRLLIPLLATDATDCGSGESDHAATPERVSQQIEAFRIAGPLLVDETEDLGDKLRAMRAKALPNSTKWPTVINRLCTVLPQFFRRLS